MVHNEAQRCTLILGTNMSGHQLLHTTLNLTILGYRTGSQTLGRDPFVGRRHMFMGSIIFCFLILVLLLYQKLGDISKIKLSTSSQHGAKQCIVSL